ncbi:MAG TPA: two-component regulator propeller domain-containing protein [Parafilimonas sp.]|nr:two-component regulator propeller domain-containing protein [Parafilimonas sp.]
MKISYPLLLLLLMMVGINTSAQTATPLHFKSLTINDGLSQGFVSSITQDKQGYLWFATGDGLNKYDGYTFTVYHHDPDDSASIGSDDLTYIFEDSQQRLWIGTRNNGLDYFERETNTFYHFRHSNVQSLVSDKVGVIREDKSGALWISTDQGISRMEILPLKKTPAEHGFFEKNTFRFSYLKPDINVVEKKSPNSLFGSVFIDSRGHMFFATARRMYELVLQADNTYGFIKRFETQVKDSNFIASIIEDTASYSLFMNGESIIRFPGYDFNLSHVVYEYKQSSPAHVWLIDKNQMIWISELNGIRRIHIPDNEQRVYVPADSTQLTALTTTTCLFSDKQGILWIGTGGYGILKYDPEIERFHHILPDTKHYQILETKPGEIITNSFNRIALSKDQPPQFEKGAFIQFLQQQFLNKNIIYFTKDTSGNLWIPDGDRIHYYNLKTKEKRIYNIEFAQHQGPFYPLYADKKNNLWFGVRKHFVAFDPASGKGSIHNYPFYMQTYEDDFLQTIYEDGNTLWLGTIHGLFKFNIREKQVEQSWFFQSNDTTSLSNNFVYCFCNDMEQPDRYLWVGTKGGGLNRLDKTTGKFVRYNTKNGLANNVIYGILPGDDGNLWLSTNKGLSAFNPVTKQFRNYDAEDGLQSNEFNRYAYCKMSDGLLVFGGMNGINYFDPNEIKPLEPPDITFTDFRLFNKPVSARDPASPLKENINYAKEIILQYKQNVITFQFAAMDYRREGNIIYRYKMKGFDKDWIYSGTAHEATYTNLDPGEYDFIVQASFDKNIWDEKSKSIHLLIITPWYKTWWFYVLMALATAAVIYGLYRFRLYQLKRLDKLRNRIARDLHDEVGSSISTIAIYSKIMQEQVNSVDFDNRPLVNKINDFAAEIMESMNDIVWSINTKNDAFDRIISRMREQASQLLEAKGYIVHFNFDEALNRMKLNMDKRREFYLIYKEAINNIAKYAGGENVWITLHVQNSFIMLAIKDDGKGFDKSKIRSGGNGLNNMQHRTQTLKGEIIINASPGEGTEIQLKFYAG